MIVKEFFKERTDGVKLYRTCSDAGFMIRQTQTGAEYAEAIDVEGAAYTYEETDEPIEAEYDEADDMKTALGILLGEDGAQ